MTDAVRNRCDRFAANYEKVRRAYRMEYRLLHALTAYCAAERDRDLDLDALKDAGRLLKDNTGPFSSFRSAVRLIYAGALALESDPHAAFDRVQEAYSALKTEFSPSGCLPVAAFALARAGREGPTEETARLTRAIYDAMKADHPFLTGGEDVAFAALAACRGLSAPAASAGVESAYVVLRQGLGAANGVQTAAQILSLSGDPVAAARTLLRLWQELKDKKRPFGRDIELIGLAALALTPSPDAALVCEIDDDLRRRRGFGNWTLGARQRRMYAALLAALGDGEENGPDFTVDTVLAAATTRMIAQQQAATAAAVSAST